MPHTSRIARLVPPDIRDELDQKLKGSSFSGYEEHLNWLHDKLKEQSIDLIISYPSFGRYAKRLKDRHQEVRQRQEELTSLAELKDSKIFDGLLVLAYNSIYDKLTDPSPDYEEEIKGLVSVIRSLSTLNCSDITAKRYELEREKRETLVRELQEEMTKNTTNQGISDKTLRLVEELLGVPCRKTSSANTNENLE